MSMNVLFCEGFCLQSCMYITDYSQ